MTAAALAVSSGLRFDPANGFSVSFSGSYVNCILNSSSGTRFSNLQIEATDTSGFGARPCIWDNVGAAGLLTIDRCILETEKTVCIDIYGSSQKIDSSLCVVRGNGRAAIANIKNGAQANNTAFVVPSDKTAATVALVGQYATAQIKNCAIFGVVALSSGTAPTYTTCFNDLGSPPSGVTQVTYDTSLFNNITNATCDYRIPLGSSLKDAGTTVADSVIDIVGRTRPSGTYDVGPWEYPDDVTTDLTGLRLNLTGGPVLWPAFGDFGYADIRVRAPISSAIIELRAPEPALVVPVTVIAMGTPEVDNSIIDLYPPGFAPAAGADVALTGLVATATGGVFMFDVVQALTGQAATATGGALVPNIAVTLTGQAATATSGVLVPNDAVVLTGQAATATGGVLTPNESIALTGQAGTASGGVIVPVVAVVLTGQAATATAGTLVPNEAVTLTGQAGTATGGLLTPNLVVVLTGQAATGSIGSFSFAGNVDQALTGLAATATGGVLVPVLTVALTGQAAAAMGGVFVPLNAPLLTGQVATAVGGLCSVSITAQLVGGAAALSGGLLSPAVTGNVTQALTGLRLNTAFGVLSSSFALHEDLFVLTIPNEEFVRLMVNDLVFTTLPDDVVVQSDDDSMLVRTNVKEEFVN